MMSRFLFGCFSFLILFSGCSVEDTPLRRRSWVTMGTVAQIQTREKVDLAPLQREANQIYQQITAEFSAWDDTSTLSLVNREAAVHPVPVSPAFSSLLQRVLRVSKSGGGAFNPLVGPLLACWGIHRKETPPVWPSEESIQRARALLDLEKMVVTNGTVRFLEKGMRLDLGGVVKGFAVDCVWRCFSERGVSNLLIDLGGNLRCLGEAEKGRGGWHTAIRDPFQKSEIAATFLLRPGEAVATSGSYERFVTIGDKRVSHILDPRSGQPASGVASVTVVAPTAEMADLLSTTLFLLGPDDGADFLAREKINCDVLWIPDQPDQPEWVVTPGFRQRNLQSAYSVRILDSLRPD